MKASRELPSDGMISIEEARERILRLVPRLDVERKPLRQALGQVLAESVTSSLTIPPLDNTAMDGYAVRAADTICSSGASPVQLRVIGEVPAGYVYDGFVGEVEAV